MLTRAFSRLAFWFPYALVLTLLTISAVEPLTIFIMWRTTHIPPDASLSSLDYALALEVPVFLILLAIPKVVIYFWGMPQRKLKTFLFNMVVFFVIPILAWLVLPHVYRIAWILIAFAAWTEALQIMFASKFPERTRKFWRLD